MELEMTAYVKRIQNEVEGLESAALGWRVPAAWQSVLQRRVANVNSAVSQNVEFITRVNDLARTDMLHEELSTWDGGMDEHDDAITFQTISSDWDPCGATDGYSTIDELLAHLVRDYSGRPSLHLDALLSAVDRSQQRLVLFPRVLVLGCGVGGIVHKLLSVLTSADVTATECSALFFAALRGVIVGGIDAVVNPWVSNFGGAVAGDETDQFESVEISIPSLNANKSRLSFVHADALRPRAEGRFDLIVTMYFVDAAAPSGRRGVLELLDAVADQIAEGGEWINLGPLHYHRADAYPKLSAREMLEYMKMRHAMTEVEMSVLDEEDYSRSRSTALSLNAHRAVLFTLKK